MRNSDGTLNGDLNDSLPAYTSGSIGFYPLSDHNENQTTYDLLPVFINKPPIIVSPISEASNPPIKPYAAADASGDYLYTFPDGSTKVSLGATFTFKIVAQQPSVLNVENGIPTMLPPNQGLTYVWRKDGNLVTSYELESLQASLVVSGSTLAITNVQPEHAGAYVCEVQNDIGTTTSETINLEVLNLDFDEFFYKNLVKNPYGKDGTDEWESNNDDFTTKQFSEIPSSEFKKPNRVDIFGYTPDMLHPRPYQIDTGVLRGFDMTEDLVLNRGSYFTRAKLKYLKNGGTTVVRAYQDIDLADIQSLIKGGVFGVEGVRAVFSCYIGNAINNFQLVKDLLPVTRRTDLRYYVGSAPRLSIENTLNSGPPIFPQEDIYVSVEEFDNDIRLSSKYFDSFGNIQTSTNRLVVRDPWFRKWNRLGNRVYPNDVYNIGSVSNGDYLDATLLTAMDLYPNKFDRYTYGQYVEFNKLVLDRLNPKTTKVRITINFICNDPRLFENFKNMYQSSDEIFDILSWEFPWKKNSWQTIDTTNYLDNTYQTLRRQDTRFGGSDPINFIPLGNDPRGMVTALNLTLLPILTQNQQLTQNITNNILSVNNTPASTVPSALQGRTYDPMGLLTKKWRLNFKLNDKGLLIDNNGFIVSGNDLELSIQEIKPSQTPRPVSILDEGLFPNNIGNLIFVEGINDLFNEDPNFERKYIAAFKGFSKYRYISQYNINDNINQIKPTYVQKYNEAAGLMQTYQSVTDKMMSDRITASNLDIQSIWSGKARYYISFALPGTGQSMDPLYYTQLLNFDDYFDYTVIGSVSSQTRLNHQYPIIGYLLDFDFSDINDTKIKLSRTKQVFPPDDPNVGSTYVLSGSYNIDHNIGSDLVLRCSLSNVLTASMEDGGMGYKTIRQVLPSNQFIMGAQSMPVIPINSRTTESIVRINDKPVQCIRALRTNIGAYSYVPLRQNYFYTKKITEVLQPVIDDITALEDLLTINAPYTLNELKNYSASLVDYAYNGVPYLLQTGTLTMVNEPNIYQNINQYYNSTLEIDLADTTFTNNYTFTLTPYENSQPTSTARQTLRSQALLNLPVGNVISPSLISLRPVDSRDSDGIGSPSYGVDNSGEEYIVTYAPLQDKVAGTYL